jgi:uncharacterized membrane protein YfcA
VSALVCIVAGVVAGLAGGLFGLGGGAIIVPFLVIALKYDQHRAQGTSLFSLALPVAALGAYVYYADGKTSVFIGLTLAAGMALGSFLGAKIALGLNARTMRQAFCAFLAIVAVYLFIKSEILHTQSTDLADHLPLWAYLVASVAGIFAGITGGLFGVGGGIVVVPFMVLALGFPQHLAQGTSLLALSLPVAGFGAYSYFKKGSVDVKAGLCVSAGVVVGSLLGSQIATGLDAVTMQRAFAVFVIFMASYMFFRK